ncbi:MAG: hypothetical protein QOJ65_1761 [Fimbriimonadaceae bacterium]|jgi:hypothetical protein|nr:hypothetical protein [Fimbriimonadaceae bacterium]
MRSVVLCLSFVLATAAYADAPFPDSPKNHWVYKSMRAIVKDKLWYRGADHVPLRKIRTRQDLGTKTLFLAMDSRNLIDSFAAVTRMVATPARDPQSKKWVANFRAGFPRRKALYRTHLKRILRLWSYFRPEIRKAAKNRKVDATAIGKRLISQQKQIEQLRLPRA